MKNYSDIIDKVAIFISCGVVFIFQSDAGVVPMLVAITASSMLSYFDDARIKTGITATFTVLCVLNTPLAFFLPLIWYDLIFTGYQYINLLSVLPLLEFYKAYPLRTIAFYAIIAIISLLLRYKTMVYSELKKKYNIIGDAKNEMSIQLKKQNNDLLEKQDYEVNLATLNERNRIAREIHDSVGHLLSSSILQVGALITINRDERMTGSLKNLNSTLSQAMTSIRNSVHNLYDESIDLNAQVEEILAGFTFCSVSFDYGLTTNPDKKLKYALIFIIKESLSNIIKHSNATSVSITFREHPAIYQLIIRDNGNADSFSTEDGLGLKNMSDRVGALNGNIHFSTENGFEIFISVPKGDL